MFTRDYFVAASAIEEYSVTWQKAHKILREMKLQNRVYYKHFFFFAEKHVSAEKRLELYIL